MFRCKKYTVRPCPLTVVDMSVQRVHIGLLKACSARPVRAGAGEIIEIENVIFPIYKPYEG